MLTGTQITVAGAGIGGLAAAVALARRGAAVTVLERAPEIAEVGAGIQVSPNGMAVLAALGLAEAVRGAGSVSRAVTLRDHAGRRVLRIDQSRYAEGPHPFVLIHRARLIGVLERAAREAGVEIRLGHEVRPSDPPLPGESLRIVAEGIKSEARATLNGPEKPFFTGQAAWRAVIPGDGGPPEAQVFMGPRRHLVTYPLAGGLRNIVAVEERDSWTEEGWSHPDDPAILRDAFRDFAPEVQGWLAAVETLHVWGLFRHPVAELWHSDAWALLGDSAHPTLPFLAQGANLALEDAWVLADCLSILPPEEALAIYQARRKPRAIRVVEAANANARNFHYANPAVRFLGHTALRLGSAVAPNAALRRFAWLYDHDVTEGAAGGPTAA